MQPARVERFFVLPTLSSPNAFRVKLNFALQMATVSIAANLPELIERMEIDAPRVILLDEELLQDAPLCEFLRQLTKSCPGGVACGAQTTGRNSCYGGGRGSGVRGAPRRIYSVGRAVGRAPLAVGAAVWIVRVVALVGNVRRRGGNFPSRDQQSAYRDPGERGAAAFAWCAIAGCRHAKIADRGGPCGPSSGNHPAPERRVG